MDGRIAHGHSNESRVLDDSPRTKAYHCVPGLFLGGFAARIVLPLWRAHGMNIDLALRRARLQGAANRYASTTGGAKVGQGVSLICAFSDMR